ncbi:MAG: hypothetical protein Q8K70_11770 [Bacteroidota bacterium]|nr:hypothetical protein [Bacteroidota bacterium]
MFFISCSKKNNDSDIRNAIIGDYTAIDSLFEFDSIVDFKAKYRLIKILRHPHVTVSKSTYMNDKNEWVKGIQFQTIEKDIHTDIYDKKGLTQLLRFKITNSNLNSVYMEGTSMGSNMTGTYSNDQIIIIYNSHFLQDYSVSHLFRIK